MTPDDLQMLTWAGEPALSPDGSQVAYTVTGIDADANRYRSRLWLAPTDESGPARPITSGDGSDAHPVWSPDGSWLAFTRSSPDESTLRLLPIGHPGEVVTVARSDEAFGPPAFSPDGRSLAWARRVRSPHADLDTAARPPRRITSITGNRRDGVGWLVERTRHVWVAPVDGSAEPRDLTPDAEHDQADPVFTPDGRAVLTTAHPGDDRVLDFQEYLVRIEVEDGARTVLLGGDVSVGLPTPLPDGRIAVVGHENPRLWPSNLHVGLVADGAVEWISEAVDRTWAPFPGARRVVALPDGGLLAALEDRGRVEIRRIGADGSIDPVVDGERLVTAWDAVADADGSLVVAVTVTTSDRPAELWIGRGHPGELTEHRVSHVTDAFVATASPVTAERFTAPSGDVEVDAWILTPPDFDPSKRYPTLLNIHGGPFAQYGVGFFDEAQLQARAGYVVLLSNPRGGSGRETAWGQAILFPDHAERPGSGWGGVDYDDLMAVVDTAIERYPFVDPERLGVLGGSYGGFMTTWIVGHTDRFVAACSERAVNNLLGLLMHSDIGMAFEPVIGLDPVTDAVTLIERSPIHHADRIETPMLILHSEDDLRCTIDQADQLYVALRSRDRDVEYHRFPGEGHELSRSGSPAHRRQRAEIILDFFGRHLPTDATGTD